MIINRSPRWSLYEATVPPHNELFLDVESINARMLELDQQKDKGTLLTNNPNIVQHHISDALEALARELTNLPFTASIEKLSTTHRVFRWQASYCRARLVPAFYGTYLQDRTLLDVGSKYWQIEATYIRALQTIKDEISFQRRMSPSNQISKKQRAQFIERYMGAFKQFFVDTYNFLEELRFRLPSPGCARPIKIN